MLASPKYLEIRVSLSCIWNAQVGGLEYAIYNLCRGLVENGVRLDLAIPDNSRINDDFLSWARSKVSKVCVSRATPIRNKSLRFIEETINVLFRDPKNWTLYPNYFLPPLKGRDRLRAVLIHDCQHRALPDFISWPRKVWLEVCYRWALKHADVVFAISEWEKNQLIKFYGLRHACKIHVIYNAIDLTRFKIDHDFNRGANTTNRSHESITQLLSVCHQFKHKNLTTIIEAFFLMVVKFKMNVCLNLVGTPSDEVNDMIDKSPNDVRSKIVMAGHVSNAELGRYYQSADLFLFPSKYEGFGMPVIEAACLGVPCLSSDAGALPEVTRGYVELISADATAAMWAEKVRELISKPREIDSAARDALEKLYSPVAVGRRIVAALNAFDKGAI